jgi:hypothetical protein
LQELTALQIFSPHAANHSVAMQLAEQTGAVEFHPDSEYRAELIFDRECKQMRLDLQPALPLVLRW